jgi:hypothetical protein
MQEIIQSRHFEGIFKGKHDKNVTCGTLQLIRESLENGQIICGLS